MSGQQTGLLGDDLFTRMFHTNGQPHPLIEMAWADWQTDGNSQNHPAFLKEHHNQKHDAAESMWRAVQEQLVWKYLYPSSKWLGSIIRAIMNILFRWVESPADYQVTYGNAKELGELKGRHPQLWDETQKLVWLAKVRKACQGPFFKWDNSDPMADQSHFTSLGAFVKLVPHIEGMIGQSDRYQPQKANVLLGNPKDGWNEAGLIALLVRPLIALVTDVATSDNFNFGSLKEQERFPPYGSGFTDLGKLHFDLQEQYLKRFHGDTSESRLGAAFFVVPPATVKWCARFGGQKQNVDKRILDSYMVDRGLRTNDDFKELLGLAGYKYADWTRPAVQLLGLEYEKGETRLSGFLQANFRPGAKPGAPFFPEDFNNISGPTWDGIKFVMEGILRVKTTPEPDISREAKKERDVEVAQALLPAGDPRPKKRKRGRPGVFPEEEEYGRGAYIPDSGPFGGEIHPSSVPRAAPTDDPHQATAAYSLKWQGGGLPFTDAPREADDSTGMLVLAGGAAALAFLALR